MNRIAKRIFAYEEDEITGEANIKQYEGNYDDYLEKSGVNPYNINLKKSGQKSGTDAGQGTGVKNGAAVGQAGAQENYQSENGAQLGNDTKINGKPKSTKLKMSYNEMREFEKIDEEIAALEEKVQHLETEITKNARDFVKLNELTKEKEETEEKLSEKMDRWVYLNDLNDRINAQ